ncbi:ribonuclease T2 [Amaricoccus sp.]|uniref:ribonuclease T2 n=1 Tax=Amaricoccus sp. TaxID=1872485 RepID=UPI0025BE1C15|nr:ribonuclease T2 [Amaricoccus sp.]
MRAAITAAAAACLAAVLASPGSAADFDYWLLALSWSPSWCADAEGDPEGDSGGDAGQCAPERDLGYVLHGLWPQFEDGWPGYCDTDARPPSRRETAAMADVMGSGGLAWHTWKKHGTCSGLPAADYFALSRFAFGLIAAPEAPARTTAAAVEAGFLAANPGLGARSVVVTCRDGLLREVRICLDRDLAPRPCGADVLRGDCRPDRPLSAPAAP